MEIKIGKYILRSDDKCMWVEEEYTQENGKTASKRVAGYATTWANLIHQFADTKLKDNDAKSLKEILAICEQTLNDLEELNKAKLKEDFRIIRRKAKESK